MYPFNVEVSSPKNGYKYKMIRYACFILLVSEFKHNFTDKYFINYIISQVIDQFRFKSRQNNTLMNPNFENSKFEHTNLALNDNITTF